MARATSVRPAPIRPAKPRISPSYRSKLTSRSRLLVDSPSTDITTGRSVRTFSGRALVSIWRPTIREITWLMVVSEVVRVSMYCPSRITVIRSAIRFSSGIRCEMYTTPVSGVTKRRIRSCRVSTSTSLSAAVGSSMIRTLESYDKALAISTICCLATVSEETRAFGSSDSPSRSSSSRAWCSSRRGWVKKPPVSGSQPRKMFCATVR